MLNHWPIYSVSKRLKRTSEAEDRATTEHIFFIQDAHNIVPPHKEAWNSNSCFSPSNLQARYLFYILCSYGMGGGKTGSQDFLQNTLYLSLDERIRTWPCSSVRLTAVTKRAFRRTNDWCSSVLVTVAGKRNTDPCLQRAQETNQKRISLERRPSQQRCTELVSSTWKKWHRNPSARTTV